jgi:hypothetical protein
VIDAVSFFFFLALLHVFLCAIFCQFNLFFIGRFLGFCWGIFIPFLARFSGYFVCGGGVIWRAFWLCFSRPRLLCTLERVQKGSGSPKTPLFTLFISLYLRHTAWD